MTETLDLNDFITDCEFKTPSMTIMIYNEKDELQKSFVAPAGFQWDRYMMAVYSHKRWYKPAGEPRGGVLRLYITD
jgi:hypothetical protein